MPNGMYGGVRGEDKTSPTRLLLGKFSKLPYNTKTLREDRTAAEWEYVAYETRRRRRIL